jgi:hypothetical protein
MGIYYLMYSTLAIETQKLKDELIELEDKLYDLYNEQKGLVFYEHGGILFENIEYDRKLTRKIELLTKEKKDLEFSINGYEEEMVLEFKNNSPQF